MERQHLKLMDMIAAIVGALDERELFQSTLTSQKAVATVESYWPYATTLFDYIRRAMPFTGRHVWNVGDAHEIGAVTRRAGGLIEQEIAAIAIAIPADGKGLPSGQGDYARGKQVSLAGRPNSNLLG